MKKWGGGLLFVVICTTVWWFWLEIYEGPADSLEAFIKVETIESLSTSQGLPVQENKDLTNLVGAAPMGNTASTKKVKSEEVKETAAVTPKSPEFIESGFKAREFAVPDSYPGHNLEIFEEKKVEFLIQELNLLPADAEEVSRRYVESIEESNQVMRNRPDEAVQEMSRIVGEYEEWLKSALGEEGFLRYSKFVDQTMRDLQDLYHAQSEKQKNNARPLSR